MYLKYVSDLKANSIEASIINLMYHCVFLYMFCSIE